MQQNYDACKLLTTQKKRMGKETKENEESQPRRSARNIKSD